MIVSGSDLEILGAIVGLLEDLWGALRSLLEDLGSLSYVELRP